jgi:hypothetical protein
MATAYDGRLRRARAGAKAGPAHCPGSSDMVAIGVIALFIIVFGALNFFEFGRVD